MNIADQNTVDKFTTFIDANYEMFAAIAWGGYRYTHERGFLMVTVALPQTYLLANYIPICDLAEGRLPPVTEQFLKEKTASYDPKKGIVVLATDAQDCWANHIEHPEITPLTAYRKHRVTIESRVAAIRLEQFNAPGARLN